MLTPEYLENLDNSRVIEIYNQLNIDICGDIISRLIRTKKLTDYTRKQLEVLKQTDGDKVFNDTLLKTQELDTSVKEALMNMYKEVGQEDIDSYKKLYEYRNISPKLTDGQLKILNNAILRTSGELSNMTKTIAFSSQQLYVNAVDRAYMQVVSGGIDYNTAIKNCVNELTQKGITLQDSLGRNIKLSTAVRRNILTGVKQTADNINKDIDKQLGCDGYETTAHLGARPTHQEWQGRQFATTPELAEKYDVELWDNSDAKEELNDYNCRHTYFGIILGVSEPIYTKAELDMLNDDKIDVIGEEMSIQEAISKKNYIERKLENYTRSKNTLDSLQKQDKIQAINELLKEYNEKIDLFQTRYKEISLITDVQGQALTRYTGFDATKINIALRKGELTKELEEKVGLIDNAISKASPMYKETIVYRGAIPQSLEIFSNRKKITDEDMLLLQDTIQSDAAFMSTSSTQAETLGRNVIMTITIPKGYKGALSIKDYAVERYKYQNEILIKRNAEFYIKSVIIKDNKYYLDVELI